MKIYSTLQDFKPIKNAVVTIGTFDGVHCGHNVVIEQLKKAAKKINGETVVLTFFPHPRMVVFPDDNDLRLLNTITERTELLEKAGIDHLIIHRFTKEFSRISAVDFVRTILADGLNAKKVIIGYDHHFGRNREGNFEDLKMFGELYGFSVEEIPAQDIQQINISSTKIRSSLIEGEINAANQFLGHSYFLKGKVVEGEKIGRAMGFPTANIEVDAWYKLIPKNGVYAVKVEVRGSFYNGMLNIGNRPTVNGKAQTIEVHIFNFNTEIYSETIVIHFIARIRNEITFDDLTQLKNQLTLDKITSEKILS